MNKKDEIYKAFRQVIDNGELKYIKINTPLYELHGIKFLKAWDKAKSEVKSKILWSFVCSQFKFANSNGLRDSTIRRYFREFIQKEKKRYLWSF